jgi:hypothetical protein
MPFLWSYQEPRPRPQKLVFRGRVACFVFLGRRVEPVIWVNCEHWSSYLTWGIPEDWGAVMILFRSSVVFEGGNYVTYELLPPRLPPLFVLRHTFGSVSDIAHELCRIGIWELSWGVLIAFKDVYNTRYVLTDKEDTALDVGRWAWVRRHQHNKTFCQHVYALALGLAMGCLCISLHINCWCRSSTNALDKSNRNPSTLESPFHYFGYSSFFPMIFYCVSYVMYTA